MSSIESILDINKFAEWIGLQTNSANICLNGKIQEWLYDTKRLSQLSTRFRKFKEVIKKDPSFYTLQDIHFVQLLRKILT